MQSHSAHIDSTDPAPARLRQAIALALKGFALLAGAFLTVAAIFFFVRDGNDYAKASVLKHERLLNTAGRRIVLVGGSNLAFGVDSNILEHATACPVVNMGMNGYLGVRFMLEEVKPHLRPQDIVVVTLEYDSFHKSIKGTATDQLMIVKSNPETFSYLDWEQRLDVLRAIPYATQQKALRLMRESKDNAVHWLLGREPERPILDINEIESLAGFTEKGDLVSHLGRQWPWELEDGLDMTHIPRDRDIVPLLTAFTSEMQARGVDVLISHTSVIESFYRRHQRSIDDLYQALAHSPPLIVPSPPTAYVYGEKFFFDTVYHLNAEGRRLRSERLARDIGSHFKDEPLCAPNSTVAKN